MGWQDLIVKDKPIILPWLGGRSIWFGRGFTLEGKLPPEHGWWTFLDQGSRTLRWDGSVTQSEPAPDWAEKWPTVKGYLVGDHLIPDNVCGQTDPDRLRECAKFIHLADLGLEKFSRAVVARHPDGRLIWLREEWPLGPEPEVLGAWHDRLSSLDHVAGVTPALDMAFRWSVRQREWNEEMAVKRRAEAEAERLRLEAEARKAELAANAAKLVGTGEGRRLLAEQDFEAAAKAALAVSGADLLDARQSRIPNEMVVQWRFRNRRLECVVDKATLRIIDAGICLADHRTGEKGDTRFTLESLPSVVKEALDEGKLHVWRHVAGDQDWEPDDNNWDDA